MTYKIYIAKERSVNEGQGNESINQVATANDWEEAYKIMTSIGEGLKAAGWSESTHSRSQYYCNDVWLEPDNGQLSRDWHQIHVIASIDSLTLDSEGWVVKA